MSSRRKRTGSAILLPWERRRAWLSELTSGRRWRALALGALAASVVVLAYRVADRHGRVRSTRASIAQVQRAIAAFRAEMERCPRSKTELVHPPRAGAQYLTEIPTDGWGRELLVRCPSPTDPIGAEIISAGPSGSFADDDNIL
ncbi:MAG TPA: type II secretion system protein GspG [Polyangiales bacterium]|nr:type II secretion system protein GspG [Polyangiales bacterium]